MRLLLDESLPENLRYFIDTHEVETARFRGWKGRPDRDLLPLAQTEFDVIMTCDQSIPNQQSLAHLDLRIFVFHGRTNRIEDLLPLLPQALAALDDPTGQKVVNFYPSNLP